MPQSDLEPAPDEEPEDPGWNTRFIIIGLLVLAALAAAFFLLPIISR